MFREHTTTVAELRQIMQSHIDRLRAKLDAEQSVSRRFDIAGRVLTLENCLTLIRQALEGYNDE